MARALHQMQWSVLLTILVPTATDCVPKSSAACVGNEWTLPQQRWLNHINVGNDAKPILLDWDGDGDKDVVYGGPSGQVFYAEACGPERWVHYSGPYSAGGNFRVLGLGHCMTGYYAGWVAADAADIETCASKCLSEPQCRFFSLRQHNTCSRYTSAAGDCSGRGGNGDHLTFARLDNQPVPGPPHPIGPIELLGAGQCDAGYHDGEGAAADATDLATCARKCMSESQCRFFAFAPGLSCARYTSAAGDCSNRPTGGTTHTAYALLASHWVPDYFQMLRQGHCSAGYYAGPWDAQYAVDLETCARKCLSEPQCEYISFREGVTCARYTSDAMGCPTINLHHLWVSYRKGHSPFWPVNVSSRAAPAIADWDGDGDLDLVVGAADGQVSYFEQNSSGIFEPRTGAGLNPFHGVSVQSNAAPSVTDWDGDGDLDLLVGSGAGRVDYFERLANGTMVQRTGTGGSPVAAVEGAADAHPFAVDWDGDSDTDLLVGDSTGKVSYFLRGSDGGLSPTFGSDNPFSWYNIGSTAAPFVLDWDGDGALDLVVGSTSSPLKSYQRVRYWRLRERTGPGKDPFVGIDVGHDASIVIVDWDNDTDLDLIAGNGDGKVMLYERLSDSSLKRRDGAGVDPFHALSVGSGAKPFAMDWDGDGDLDLIVGGADGRVSYFERQADGSLVQRVGSGSNPNPFDAIDVGDRAAPAAGDLDGDGDADLIVGAADGRVYYFQRQGDGSVVQRTGSVQDPLFHDINVGSNAIPTLGYWNTDDTILDFIIGNEAGEVYFYTNHLTRKIHQPQYTQRLRATNAAPCIADWDGDGDKDFIAGVADGQLVYFEYAGCDVPSACFLQGLCSTLDWRCRCLSGYGAYDCAGCAAGFKQGPLETMCNQCPAGKWSAPLSSSCNQCEQGHYSAARSATCSMCPVGKQASTAQDACEDCPSHQYSVNGVCMNCTDGAIPASDRGSCTSCLGGAYALSGSATCMLCEPGKYGAGGSACTPCGSGTYSARGWSACQQCASGFIPADDAGSCVPCESGNYSKSGDTSCTPCANGTMASAGSDECTPCQSGYIPDADGGSCVPCPAGTSSVRGDDMCTPCGAGTHAEAASDTCTSCPTNKHAAAGSGVCDMCGAGLVPASDGASCTPCAAGRQAAMGSATCTVCASGYAPTANGGSCAPCARGTYAASGHASCTPCANGSIASAASEACTPCPSGTVPDASAGSCEPCPAGKFAVSGDAECTPCAAGKYAQAASGSCSSCPKSAYAAEGRTCRACGSGSVQTSDGTACARCAPGRHATTGSTACTACPGGTVPAADGGSCVPCLAGTYAASGHAACTPCANGTAASAESDACAPCSNGYIPDPDAGSCLPCPAGSFAESGDVECTLCGPGTYAQAASSSCTACAADTYAAAGSGACQACSLGEVPAGDGGSCAPCAPGTHAAAGSSACAPCPGGRIPTPDRGSCQPCSAGTYPADGDTWCAPCANGSYASAASEACSLCPNGHVPASDGGSCLPCAAGTFAVSGYAECTPCGLGTSAQAASSECSHCAQGLYAPPGSRACVACGSGTVPANDGGSCTPCGPGKHAIVGSSMCVPCDGGHVPAADRGSCQRCPEGTYAASGHASCTPCADGTYAPAASRACARCASGYVPAADGGSCLPCAAGTYAVSGDAWCSPCGNGTKAAAASGACSDCPQGKVAGAGSGSCAACGSGSVPAVDGGSCVPCAAGTYAVSGDATCKRCSAGTYSEAASGACGSCPSGRHSATMGGSSCAACPSGHVPAVDSASCTPCDAGTTAVIGDTACTPCQSGKYSSSASSACIPCESGKVAVLGRGACSQCPSGRVPTSDGGSCRPCPAGTSAAAGSVECTPCSNTTFARAASGECTQCESGSVPTSDRQSCDPCEPGTFADRGSAGCTPCSPGTYSEANSGRCSPCATNMYSLSGSSACSLCQDGFVPASDGGSCVPCGNGTYAVSGDETCAPCSPGTYSAAASRNCTACETGKVAEKGSRECATCPLGEIPANASGTCTRCAAGTWAASGSTSCTPCTLGTYTQVVGSSTCHACAAGRVAAAEGSATCADCPGGSVPASDSGSCTHCPSGTSAASGASACTPCTPGTYALAGSKVCARCESGYVATAASGACTRCNAGEVPTADGSSCRLHLGVLLGYILAPTIVVAITLGSCRRWYKRRKMANTLRQLLRTKDVPKLQAAIKRAKTMSIDSKLVHEGDNTLDMCQNKYSDMRYLLDVLKDGDVKLLKGSWLANQTTGWRLERQQDLPKEAFWTAEDLTAQQRCVLVVAVSYCWLSKAHPDPESKHFSTLRHAIRLRLQVEGPGSVEDIALFLDYCSLAQSGETETQRTTNLRRSNSMRGGAAMSYTSGMEHVDIIYANKLVEMWTMKWVPASEPRKYAARGWPFFERALAGLVTDGSRVLSLDEDIQDHSQWQNICGRSIERSAPMTPERFEEAISSRSFSKPADADFVVKKYKETFNEVVGNATMLWFTKLNWTNKDAQELVQILPYCENLEQLYLGWNSITTEGAIALAKAAKDCSRLQGLDLTCNDIPAGDGKTIFRHWVEAGKQLGMLRIDRSADDRAGSKPPLNSPPVEAPLQTTTSRGHRESIVSI